MDIRIYTDDDYRENYFKQTSNSSLGEKENTQVNKAGDASDKSNLATTSNSPVSTLTKSQEDEN